MRRVAEDHRRIEVSAGAHGDDPGTACGGERGTQDVRRIAGEGTEKHALRQRVIGELLARVGHQYDLKNIVDLARYFFPVSFIPRRLRNRALTIGSGEPTSVIYPILPTVELLDRVESPRSRWARLLGRNSSRVTRYVKQLPTLVTPRDFDLSPYFEIIKFNVIEDTKFDYRKIRWADVVDSTATTSEPRPTGARAR